MIKIEFFILQIVLGVHMQMLYHKKGTKIIMIVCGNCM